jgi:hypothetical protein
MASGGAGAGPIGVYGDRLSRIRVGNIAAGLAPPPSAAALKARHDAERDERALKRYALIEEIADLKGIAAKEDAEEIDANAGDAPVLLAPKEMEANAEEAAAHAAPVAPSRLFAILGHGVETEPNYYKRERIPEGVTLVTIVKYGEFAFLPEPCKGVQLFSNPAKAGILLNPAANIDEISSHLYTPEQFATGRRIRVYRAGTRYPTLQVIPLADWSKMTKDRSPYMASFMSGVREFPIAAPASAPFSANVGHELQRKIAETEMFIKNSGTICSPLLFYRTPGAIDPELIDRLYRGSLYPTHEDARKFIGKSVQNLKTDLRTPLSSLIRDPGVYYFFICRDTQDNLASECDNFFRFAFSSDERAGEMDDYKWQMFNFREQYSKHLDPIEKIGYFLNVLNSSVPIITDPVTGPLLMSDASFIKAVGLLDIGKERLLPDHVLMRAGGGVNRLAFEQSPAFYADHRETVGVGGRMRSSSNAEQAAAGGAGIRGGRRRLRKTQKGRRKSKLSRKMKR